MSKHPDICCFIFALIFSLLSSYTRRYLDFFHYKKLVIDRRQGSSKVGIQDTLVFLMCWGGRLLTLLSMGVSINFKCFCRDLFIAFPIYYHIYR